MAYECQECDESFESFDKAEAHHHETGHEIGAWRADA